MVWAIYTEEDMMCLGGQMLAMLPKRGLVGLHGPLGAGKTTWMRGLLRAAGHQGVVRSPTYTFYEVYACKDQEIVHGDWYRSGDGDALYTTGIDDYLDTSLCCFEWPDQARGEWPAFSAHVVITMMKGPCHGRYVSLHTD